MDERLSNIQSDKSRARLEQIAALRARGLGDHVDLPQLVVCGDQSAGKSSVLEGITGIPFPRQDGLCTKFATEIILQNGHGAQRITATIIPSSSRKEPEKASFRAFRHQLETFDELPYVISEAGKLMGVRGYGDICTGPAFARDVLRIEVIGPSHLHLTVVDLPGLISVANEEQTEEDVEIVQSLIDDYIEKPRTIILAVVQASNDIANQRIIQKARKVDRAGQRTVGIITKPDLINTGTEGRIALLAKNQDSTKLKLGYFIVKNPTPTEMKNTVTIQQRHQNEERFFRASPWKEQGLSHDRVGIVALQSFLQDLLDQHIEKEIPKVRQEIRQLIATTEQELALLGEERPTIGHLRLFLSRLAMRFHNLVTSALNGTYHESESTYFTSNEDENQCSRRLRARIHQLNASFSDYMRENGEKRKTVENVSRPSAGSGDSSDDSDDSEGTAATDPILVTKSEMEGWVQEVLQMSPQI